MKRSASDESPPAESKVSRLEADTSNHCSEVELLAAEHAVALLMVADNCRLTLVELQQKLLEQHQQLVQQWSGIETFVDKFSGCLRRVGEDHVEAHTRLEICDRFTARKGECHSALCPRLHVCKWHVVSSTSCPDNHREKHRIRSRHNKRLLKAHQLGKLSGPQVKQLLRRCRNRSTLPHCCVYYCNTQGCRTQINGGQCPFLHVCCYWMQDACRFTSSCRRSHDLHASQPAAMLRAYGINLEDKTHEQLRLMLRDAGIGLTHKPPDPPLPNGFQQLSDSDSESDSDVESSIKSSSSATSVKSGGSTAFLPPELARAEQAVPRASALNAYNALMMVRPGVPLQQYVQPAVAAYSPPLSPFLKTVSFSTIQQAMAGYSGSITPQLLSVPQQTGNQVRLLQPANAAQLLEGSTSQLQLQRTNNTAHHVNAQLSSSQLPGVQLPSTQLPSAQLASAQLSNVQFPNGQLPSTQFQQLSPMAAATPQALLTLPQVQAGQLSLSASLNGQANQAKIAPQLSPQLSPQDASQLQSQLTSSAFTQHVLTRHVTGWTEAAPSLLEGSILAKP